MHTLRSTTKCRVGDARGFERNIQNPKNLSPGFFKPAKSIFPLLPPSTYSFDAFAIKEAFAIK